MSQHGAGGCHRGRGRARRDQAESEDRRGLILREVFVCQVDAVEDNHDVTRRTAHQRGSSARIALVDFRSRAEPFGPGRHIQHPDNDDGGGSGLLGHEIDRTRVRPFGPLHPSNRRDFVSPLVQVLGTAERRMLHHGASGSNSPRR